MVMLAGVVGILIQGGALRYLMRGSILNWRILTR